MLAALGPRRGRAREPADRSASATRRSPASRCTVARTGYTGEDGVEIFCALERRAGRLARADAGRQGRSGIKAVGLGARDTLRLEARLSLYGNDIDETTNPLEAGLGWVVKLDKGDFVGRGRARRRSRPTPLPRKLVGFEMTGRGIARHGYPLRDARRRARSASARAAAPGPTVGKNIGLGYVPSGDDRGRHEVPRRLPRQEHRGGRRADAVLQARQSAMSDQVPPDRRYTKEHEWARESGGEVTVGITAFAVEQLGDITLVNLDVKVGDEVGAGKPFGTIESVKTLSDLYAPVSGQGRPRQRGPRRTSPSS